MLESVSRDVSASVDAELTGVAIGPRGEPTLAIWRDKVTELLNRLAVEEVDRIFDARLRSAARLDDSKDLFRAQNVVLIKNMSRDTLSLIYAALRESEGLHVADLVDELMRVARVGQARARLWARDQTLKLAGQLQKERQTSAGVRRYRWLTVKKDGRVRDAHARLHGTVHAWTDPPIVDPATGRRAHPGGDYQCRCQAIPILD